MSKLKFYKIATVSLLTLNIAMVALYMFLEPKPPHHRSGNALQSQIVNALHLDDRQEEAFRMFAKQHSDEIDALSHDQQSLLTTYFNVLIEPSEETKKDSLLVQFQELERQKLQVTYQHFEDIRDLLSVEQIPLFKGLMHEIVSRLLRSPNKRPSPPKDF